MKKIILYLFIFILLLVLAGGLITYFRYQAAMNWRSPAEAVIEINPGDGLDVVANRLARNNVIHDPLFFQIYSFIKDNYHTIQPGIHTIPAGTGIDQIMSLFYDNPHREITVTIPEGLTIQQTAELVSQNLAVDNDLLLAEINQPYHLEELLFPPAEQTLEGFLFPDTYRFLNDSTTDQIVIKMIQNFNEQWPENDIENSDTKLSSYEILILASIIEKEASNSEERRVISEILQSRLSEGEPLAVNATLNYILDDPQAVFSDEEIYYDSAYNTYQHKGLPPTPICNPSLDSILAVIEPTPNNYYYYLHDADGQIHYAATLDEHNANIDKYLN